MSEQQASNNIPSTRRRKLLAGLGIGLCAGAAGLLRWSPQDSTKAPVATTAAPPRGTVAPAADLPAVGTNPEAHAKFSRDWFATCRNTEFRMDTGVSSTGTAVKLVAVSPVQTSYDTRSNTTYKSFSLSFDGPREMKSEAGIYPLKHDKLGAMELFLSPIEKHDDLVRYEAVFSQRV